MLGEHVRSGLKCLFAACPALGQSDCHINTISRSHSRVLDAPCTELVLAVLHLIPTKSLCFWALPDFIDVPINKLSDLTDYVF